MHDEPIRIDDPRQRLIVALVQKKVSELLGHERFNSSFQIGMLASFESFLETTRLKREGDEEGNFDDTEQTDVFLEREGIDVADVNRLARSYRQTFDRELPHPKMDAVVDELARAWTRGEKSLVFARRVASVKELKRKLDERYDAWLQARLLKELPESVHPRLKKLFEQYRSEQARGRAVSEQDVAQDGPRHPRPGDEADRGGTDTFFAWFFRGEGPRGVISGANVQQRFIQRGTIYATFFEDNYVADVLGCRPAEVKKRLARVAAGLDAKPRSELQERSRRFLTRAQKHARADRFGAVQAAAIEWLKDSDGPHIGDTGTRRLARAVRILASPVRTTQAPDIGDWLELRTFFTELRQRPDLRERLWPQRRTETFREHSGSRSCAGSC